MTWNSLGIPYIKLSDFPCGHPMYLLQHSGLRIVILPIWQLSDPRSSVPDEKGKSQLVFQGLALEVILCHFQFTGPLLVEAVLRHQDIWTRVIDPIFGQAKHQGICNYVFKLAKGTSMFPFAAVFTIPCYLTSRLLYGLLLFDCF